MSRSLFGVHDQAAAMIEAAIATDRRIMRQRLNALDRLEAIALIGFLLADTLERFPADEQADVLAALIAGLQDGPPDA